MGTVRRNSEHLTIKLPDSVLRAPVARLSRAANAVQMRVGSDWLAALARPDGAEHGALFTCWWSDCDQLVYPPSTAVLAGSESRQLRGVGHLAMCEREEIWDEIRRRIGR